MTTVGRTLRALTPLLPAALVSADTLSRIQSLVGDVPEALAGCCGFECSLADRTSTADFGIQVSSAAGGYDLLGGSMPQPRLPPRLLADPVWRRIGDFGHALSAGTTLMRHVWLVFDLRGVAAEAATPNVFLGQQLRSTEGQSEVDPSMLDRSISALRGSGLPPSVRRTLDSCRAALTADMQIASVGVLLGRRTDALRVCIDGLMIDHLPTFLAAMRWDGPIDAACEVLSPFRARRHHVTVDVGATIGPRIGVECFVTHPDEALPCESFLRDLVDRQLCSAVKCEALVSWKDRPLNAECASIPAESVASRMRLHGITLHAIWVPTIFHIKLSYEAGRRFEAKAYFGIVRRWTADLIKASSTLQRWGTKPRV